MNPERFVCARPIRRLLFLGLKSSFETRSRAEKAEKHKSRFSDSASACLLGSCRISSSCSWICSWTQGLHLALLLDLIQDLLLALLLALPFSLDFVVAEGSACLSPAGAKKKVSVCRRREEELVPTGSALHRVAVTHGSALSQLRSLLICSAHPLNLRTPSTPVGGRQDVTSAGPGGGVTECRSTLFHSHLTPRGIRPRPRPPWRSDHQHLLLPVTPALSLPSLHSTPFLLL